MIQPSDLDAEAMVLGAMLISPKAVETCADILSPEAFYLPTNGTIFQAILDVEERGRPPDELTTAAWLDAQGLLKDDLTRERVFELSASVPSVSNVGHYCKIVRAQWIKREAIAASNEIIAACYDGPGSIEELVETIDSRLSRIATLSEGRKDSKVFTGKQVVEEFKERMQTPVDEGGVRAPFSFLAPLVGGRLYVLAGYEKDGKTLGGQLFLRSACEGGARVGFASIEMSRHDMIERITATFGVPYTQIKERKIESAFRGTYDSALTAISEWDWEIIDDETLDASSLRRHQRRGKYDLLIVDHLHRIRLRDRKHQREELEEQVKAITNISREFDIPILLLAQLSRTGSYQDPYPRPSPKSLKGTGAIEQEASHVWFIYRHRDEWQHRMNESEFIVSASRYSEETSRPLLLQPRYMRFVEGHQTGG